MKQIAILVGSLRQNSFNRRLAQEASTLISSEWECTFVDISNLPLFNEDLESDPPQEWQQFKQTMERAHAYWIFTPEYNGSTSGALKNALDIASRPHGNGVMRGKSAAIFSASLSQYGATLAARSLASMLQTYLSVQTMPSEFSLSSAHTHFDENGRIDHEARKILNLWVQQFEQFA